MSAKGKKRAKLLAAKRARKNDPAFHRHDGSGPNPNSKYGQRQLRRMRGEPMATRACAPWWSANAVVMHPDVTRAQAERPVVGRVSDFRNGRSS